MRNTIKIPATSLYDSNLSKINDNIVSSINKSGYSVLQNSTLSEQSLFSITPYAPDNDEFMDSSKGFENGQITDAKSLTCVLQDVQIGDKKYDGILKQGFSLGEIVRTNTYNSSSPYLKFRTIEKTFEISVNTPNLYREFGTDKDGVTVSNLPLFRMENVYDLNNTAKSGDIEKTLFYMGYYNMWIGKNHSPIFVDSYEQFRTDSDFDMFNIFAQENAFNQPISPLPWSVAIDITKSTNNKLIVYFIACIGVIPWHNDATKDTNSLDYITVGNSNKTPCCGSVTMNLTAVFNEMGDIKGGSSSQNQNINVFELPSSELTSESVEIADGDLLVNYIDNASTTDYYSKYYEFNITSEQNAYITFLAQIYYDGALQDGIGWNNYYLPKQVGIGFPVKDTNGGELARVEIGWVDGNKLEIILVSYTSKAISLEVINGAYVRTSIPMYEYLSNKVLENYANGKETCELRCSIVDYYDTDGNLAISTTDTTKPFMFKIGDIVEPYVADGTTSQGERALSRYIDGSPKNFQVTGVSLQNDGAIFQTIRCQETTKALTNGIQNVNIFS